MSLISYNLRSFLVIFSYMIIYIDINVVKRNPHSIGVLGFIEEREREREIMSPNGFEA